MSFLTSMKTGLFLLLAVAGGAALGTLVPHPGHGETPGKLYIFFQMGDVYHSWWFGFLLALLCINLVACNFRRWSRWWKEERSSSPFWRRISRLGSLITHTSFLIIAIGCILGGVYGFKGFVEAEPGRTLALNDVPEIKGRVPEDLALRVNNFWIDWYDNGTPSQFNSDLTILQGDREKANRIIKVNQPLGYSGIKFYQSGYGNAYLVQFSSDSPKAIREGVPAEIPGTDLLIVFYQNQMSGNSNIPGLIYAVYQCQERVAFGEASPNQQVNINGTASFVYKEKTWYTRLEVKKDPGVPVVWIGCGFLLIGLSFGFYGLSKRPAS